MKKKLFPSKEKTKIVSMNSFFEGDGDDPQSNIERSYEKFIMKKRRQKICYYSKIMIPWTILTFISSIYNFIVNYKVMGLYSSDFKYMNSLSETYISFSGYVGVSQYIISEKKSEFVNSEGENLVDTLPTSINTLLKNSIQYSNDVDDSVLNFQGDFSKIMKGNLCQVTELMDSIDSEITENCSENGLLSSGMETLLVFLNDRIRYVIDYSRANPQITPKEILSLSAMNDIYRYKKLVWMSYKYLLNSIYHKLKKVISSR